MIVSDERAEKLRKAAWTMSPATMDDCVNELLADRAERIQKEQAVIAKIEKRMQQMTASHPCWQELREIQDFIRNLKEADSSPLTTDSGEEEK